MSIYIGEVVSVDDPTGGDRIKVRLLPEDRRKTIDEIDFAFPLLPKLLQIKPKVGEASMVICAQDGVKSTQRYYIGPIISQPQKINFDDYELGATNLLRGGIGKVKRSINQSGESIGAIPKADEIVLAGRQNTDIVLSDNDVRVRCGSKIVDKKSTNDSNIIFNKNNPAFVKLKYYETPLSNSLQPRNEDSHSTATIVADEIALLSNKSTGVELPNNALCDTDEQINDKNMQEIIDKAHVLPYGDTLVDFLMEFLQMFKAHVHKYPLDRPVEDDYAKNMDAKYGRGTRNKSANDYITQINGSSPVENVTQTFSGLYDKLLSKNIRIN